MQTFDMIVVFVPFLPLSITQVRAVARRCITRVRAVRAALACELASSVRLRRDAARADASRHAAVTRSR